MEKTLFDISKMNSDFYKEAKELFSKYDTNICDNIISLVAGLYNVDREEIFSHSKGKPKLRYAIPRWLCWCALKQFTSLSDSDIARSFTMGDKPFTSSAVCKGVTSLRRLIEQDEILKSKWFLIKKTLEESINKYKEDKIIIVVPVGVKHKIEIKEAKI